MNKYIVVYVFLFLFFSCKKQKKESYSDLNSTQYFSTATDLKNLTNIGKHKINDSIYKIIGKFNAYDIVGYVKPNNKRTGWWEAKDRKTNELIARLEYRIIDNKEFVNQFVLYQKGKIDTLNSKFYSLKKTINSIKYKFYTPDQLKAVRSEGKLYYGYFSNEEGKKHLECKCTKIKNSFDCEFLIPINMNKETIIRGNFWQMFQLENGDIGQNDIYVLDTINQKLSTSTVELLKSK
ncbi:hypothetical protein [Chryseobacterium sp. 2987]|uniref:hypothetical protein n=1 Tax=Chryseobacterium sp. 2987 TaxID=2817767 RepID=UPI00285DB4DD|nr:hypothetical protein [Chryseobacterium sp. 2987]MDR6923738.1 hypothetical protein [Chryseobacterium sp. 2987]